jgi:hypothetical protein
MPNLDKEAIRARRAEVRDYAQRGIELALAWRLAPKAEAEMHAEFERRRAKAARTKCMKCGLVFASRAYVAVAEGRGVMKLTGNDLALAQQAACLAITWWKSQPGARTKFVKGRIAELQALISKLSGISGIAYPYDHSDEMPLDVGDEEIMRLNTPIVNKTRKRARPQRSVQ